MALNREQLMIKRDKKLHGVFLDYAPIWLLNDEYRARKDSFFFNIVYCHPVHSWLNGFCRKIGWFGKRDREGQETGTLSSHSKQVVDTANLGQNVAPLYSFHLPFSYHMHRLEAT
jgi:hypothetical protein